MELQLPGSITGFRAETDLEKAETFLSLEMEGDRKAEGRIYLDSCVNILMIELQGEGANSLEVKALGWDLDSPRLRPLKNWNYEPCIQTEKEGCFVVRQHFGGDRSAVLNAAGQAFKEAGKEGLRLAVSIRTGAQAEEETMAEEGSALVLTILRGRKSSWRRTAGTGKNSGAASISGCPMNGCRRPFGRRCSSFTAMSVKILLRLLCRGYGIPTTACRPGSGICTMI